jgi:hypothetical protein
MREETAMSNTVDDEDWKALMEVLEGTATLLGRKQVEPVKLGILEFSSTTAMLGLEDLAGVGSRFEAFLMEKVAPGWDEEAAATLNFAMGALLEKMQNQEYGPAFSAGLDEVFLYLSFFDDEEQAGPEPSVPTEAETQEMQTPFSTLANIEAPVAQEEPPPVQVDLHEFETDFLEVRSPETDKGVLLEAPEQALLNIEDEFELPEDIPLAVEAQEPVSQAGVEELLSMAQATVEAREVTEVPEVSGASGVFEAPEAFEVPLPPSAGEPAYEPESHAPLFETPPTPGFIGDAVAFYAEMLKHDPSSRVFVSLAEELCSKELWKEAVETCRRGLVFHPYMVRARVLLGWALWKSSEVEEAEQVLTGARMEVEKNSILYEALAEIAESKGDPGQAAHLLNTFRAIQSGGSPRQPAVSAERKAAPSQRQPIGSSVPAFLSALLRKFEQKPVRTVPPRIVFAKEDREALKDLLRGETLH